MSQSPFSNVWYRHANDKHNTYSIVETIILNNPVAIESISHSKYSKMSKFVSINC